MDYSTVLTFWFEEIPRQNWWVKDETFDQEIRNRFEKLLGQAIQGELYQWRQSARGRLAEIIVLDQFSRNIYRNLPQSFAQDAQALTLAQEAIARGLDRELNIEEKIFMYLPYMHSESLLIHEQAVELYQQPGLEMNLDFEYKHKVIIEKFGRYPHRNEILSRVSTVAEIEFLKQPNSSF